MISSTKVLILGAGGMLGTDLSSVFSRFDNLYLSDKEDLDITNRVELEKKVLDLKPDLIINATGYTDVDGAEDQKELANQINSEVVKYLAENCKKNNTKLVHFSTEYVFDGTNKAGYQEDSLANPINTYGRSKLLGENYLKPFAIGHSPWVYLIRTSWLFGHALQRGKPRGLNFIETMIKLAAEREEIKVVDDQFGKPTYTKDLAKAVYTLITESYQPGIYHLVNEGVCSWYDLAKEAFKIKNIRTPLVPVPSSEYQTKARRPQHAVLVNTKFPFLRSWPEALRDYLT